MYQQFSDDNAMPTETLSSFEIIEGTKLFMLFEYLYSGKKLVTISTLNSYLEFTTIITKLCPKDHPTQFRMDPTEDFINCCDGLPVENMIIDFNGPDGLQYRFEAKVKESTADALWIEIPQQIHRYQRRNDVRIKPGNDSHMQTVIDGSVMNLPIEDISIGGILCLCPNSCKQMIDLKREWRDVQVVLTSGMDEYHLSIPKIKIKRMARGKYPKHFSIAFVFKNMDRSNRQKLQNIINKLQRIALRERQPTK